MKTQEQMREQFYKLYNYMANSHKVEYMRTFGNVHKEMMEWFIANKSDMAEEWLCKLESIKWDNYLTHKEAEKIISEMNPKAPWTRDQWKSEMEGHGYPLEREPYYNSCALWVTMEMIMSDSSETISRYVEGDKMFAFVYEAAVDKLTDVDGNFNIRRYFNL